MSIWNQTFAMFEKLKASKMNSFVTALNDHEHDSRYYTQGTSDAKYYTQTEIDALVLGNTVQVVNVMDGEVATVTNNMAWSDVIPDNTQGAQLMSLAITPTSATNELRIDVVVNFTINNSVTGIIALFQDSKVSALSAVGKKVNDGFENQISFTFFMVAGTTSETTFKVRGGEDSSVTFTFNGSGGSRIFGGVMASSITITETKA